MLREIYCDKFHQKQIVFNSGLSVVLGTNTGDNSIGKSTFLLIVDYVFGGNTYANTADIIENVGAHDIYFAFVFGGETFKFCRNSIYSQTIWKCDDTYEKVKQIRLDDYCKWLDSKYAMSLPELSFRDAVGRYIRVYGKITAMSDVHYTTLLPKRQRKHVTRSLSFLINMYLLKKQRKQLSNPRLS